MKLRLEGIIFGLLISTLFGCGSSTEPIHKEPNNAVDNSDNFNNQGANSNSAANNITNNFSANNSTTNNDVLNNISNNIPDNNSSTNNHTNTDILASDYCETTREMFCSYYMRCGRINADSMEQCLTLFDETCNATYEPHYVALEQLGKLSLSQEGIDICAQHLEDVRCEEQVFDLDGPCADVWQGESLEGESCGAGIDSFVCQENTTCVLTMSFCGTCQTTVSEGESCGTDIGRCEQTAACVDGTCVRKSLPGQSCGDSQPCITGMSCVDGICSSMTYVELGATCDQIHRCPYNAVCVSGICESQAGLGDSCTSVGQCRTGYCNLDEGRCKPFRVEGEGCYSSRECQSSICKDNRCASMISDCH